MSDEEMKAKRPLAITVLCLWGAFGAVMVAVSFFMPVYDEFPLWYQYAVAVNAAVGCLVWIGLWKMRRWAVMLYAILFPVAQAIALATDTWMMSGLVIPAIILGIMAFYYRELS